ncbi:MAG: hypothetical protein DHS20C01_14760 [marine bacterium B5-7]|nr:MAG: hypothetical protein DHS20C01_14760 [marine bacterium B5-7]
MHPDLNFQQAPPISVPFRFFLTAPLFGVAAGLLILYLGPAVFTSRWVPSTLALTHLLTLGFISLIMCGAMMQMMPVLAGAVIPRPIMVSTLVHLLLVSGTLLMGIGFFRFSPMLLKTSALLLVIGFAVFIVAVSMALVRSGPVSGSITAMRGSILALLITATLGVLLVFSLISSEGSANLVVLANVHLTWGLLGWVGLLVIGVGYQVVPMFQITARYPEGLARYLAPMLFTGLLIWSILYFSGGGVLFRIAPVWLALCMLGFVAFTVITLRLQINRKRRTEDVTRNFWYLGMASVLVSITLWFAAQMPELASLVSNRLPFILGVCLLIGFAVSVINGMLYKIVPFLIWLHLQRLNPQVQTGLSTPIPNVKKIIPVKYLRWQFYLHLASCGALIMAAVWPHWLASPAGLVLAASFALLWVNLLAAVAVYRRYLKLLEETTVLEGGVTSGRFLRWIR